MSDNVDVLGVNYYISILENQDKFMKEEKLAGYTDFITKEIRILRQDIEKETSKVLMHEIIHAVLYESGIDYELQFHTEECVDFFALQIPKINEIVKKCEGKMK